ncbi:MAG: SU10 major capsid protein, partial [Tepidisphaeraceae bacterium]
MPFTGKATYTAGSTLPEIAEDVADLVAINSPHETPLLDALGDAARSARSTVHEWLEDALLPNTDQINDNTFANALTDTTFGVDNASRFRVGDQLRLADTTEVMLVSGVDIGAGTITVVRAYGGTTAGTLADNTILYIVGNAALEGADPDAARFSARSRKTNFTQIFSSTVEVSGSELAVRQLAVADELDYQKQQRTRELLRDLEN